MGMAVFILLAALEVGLCIWTIRKKSGKEALAKERFWVSLIQWGMITVLLLLPVGNKGLRFMVCFVILSIRCFIHLIRFLLVRRKASRGISSEDGKDVSKKREEGKRAGSGSRIFATLLSCILIAISLFPAFVFTGYEGLKTTGEYEVGMVNAILTDVTRLETFENDGSHREVPIYVYYPEKLKKGREGVAADATKFPLVLFSHGAFGYYQSNSSTYMELASHGYVVISMDHPYHSFFTKDTTGKTVLVNADFMQSALYLGNAGDGEVPEEEIFETTRDWMNLRIADASFVLDEVKSQAGEHKESLGEAWYVKKDGDAQVLLQVLSEVDTDKIGMMGHSLGGATSVTIGRLRNDVQAVIDLDGTMLGEELGYENGAYQYYDEPYPVPLLAINKESHQDSIDKYGTLYVNGWVLANAKDASYTYFKGSEHMNFTDLPLISPFLASKLGMGELDAKECIMTMNGLVLQFFDHYLKGQGEFVIRESY